MIFTIKGGFWLGRRSKHCKPLFRVTHTHTVYLYAYVHNPFDGNVTFGRVPQQSSGLLWSHWFTKLQPFHKSLVHINTYCRFCLPRNTYHMSPAMTYCRNWCILLWLTVHCIMRSRATLDDVTKRKNRPHDQFLRDQIRRLLQGSTVTAKNTTQ